MGNDSPPQATAAPETPEARRLTELQAQRLEYLNPLEQQALSTLTPLQTQLQEQQYGAQLQTLPGQTAQALQQQDILQGVLGGQLPPGYESLGEALNPISLSSPDYDQQYDTARARIEQQAGRQQNQLLAQQNVAGVLGSGGTYELQRRIGDESNMQLNELSAQQAMEESQRLQRESLLGREAEQNLLGRQASLLNLGMGAGAAAVPGVSGMNALGGVQQGMAGAGAAIQSQNAQQQASMLQQQQLAMQAAQGGNSFWGDLLGAGMMGLGMWKCSKDYKDNITDNTVDSVAVLDEIQIKEFDYKPEFCDSKHHVGMIAEDIPEILKSEDGKGIDVMNTVGVLIDANKKLVKRVEELERRLS